jgi:hypothetical protein
MSRLSLTRQRTILDIDYQFGLEPSRFGAKPRSIHLTPTTRYKTEKNSRTGELRILSAAMLPLFDLDVCG